MECKNGEIPEREYDALLYGTTYRVRAAVARKRRQSRRRRTVRVRAIHELRPDLASHERPSVLWGLVRLAVRPLLWVLDHHVDRASRHRLRR